MIARSLGGVSDNPLQHDSGSGAGRDLVEAQLTAHLALVDAVESEAKYPG
jgi:hypothetical protein